jgi:dissimilatory sulfite reductase (desulfoviridin) alpha/beta subunit
MVTYMTQEAEIDVNKLRSSGIVKLKGKNMFSTWIKTACCNLNSNQLKQVADIAEKYARGFFLFSTRQTPIIPFVHINDVDRIEKELNQVYLQFDRCGPTVRNVNVCYDDKICPFAVTNSISLGEKLDTFFYTPSSHKIKIGVAGCSMNCNVTRVLNDIGFIGVERDGKKGYDGFIGGKLGLNPSIGIKMADCLNEEECIKWVQNYFDLIHNEGKSGERAGDLIKRLGTKKVEYELNKNIQEGQVVEPIKCETKQNESAANKQILKIRATCGEVTSEQARKIAEIAEEYGKGFVHFTVRGSPEIPCVNKSDWEDINKELQKVDLKILNKGIGNIQTCFGAYCTETNMDTQSFLRKIEKMLDELNLDNLDLKISASGCPNSCGIAHLNDIGFYGVVDPEVDAGRCNGCGMCVIICKRKSIEIKDNFAVIDSDSCAHCGSCIFACPNDAIVKKQKGIAVLAGGREGENPRLGEVVAEFLSEDDALQIASRCLELLQEKNANAATVIDEVGIEGFKAMILQNN